MSDDKDLALTRSLQALRKMKAQLDQMKAAHTEPIAVIGLGCRLPGADSIDQFWANLMGGADAMSIVPQERWKTSSDDTSLGATSARRGGFLNDVAGFDAAFFEIAPREAVALDPQHRIALKVAWEALEDAGIPVSTLSESLTGVFLGIVATDYRDRLLSSGVHEMGPYSLTGNMLSAAAGRIAYTFSLMGPCVTTETACSSSLVAVHQACQSLRLGECNLALAGGVNLMLAPSNTKMLVQMGALSSDGQCKSFDAQADGLVRGEGCGIVVLKRLSDALRDGDRIDALLMGSAVNHDGKSAGFTAPNGQSQQALLRMALSRSGVSPDTISYVETHGTGTALGDPIEADAIAAVLAPTAARPCILGAVKTGVGHLEAAAGITGLLKVVLALRNGAIPPNRNFESYNGKSSALGRGLVVPTKVMDWPRQDGSPRRAGVSAFGITGTNAHVVVQEPGLIEQEADQAVAGPPKLDEEVVILPLTARSERSLAGLASRYRAALEDGGALATASLPRLAAAMVTQRDMHSLRCPLVVRDRAELTEALTAMAAGEPHPAALTGRLKPSYAAKMAFVFAGQGAQWPGMAQDLMRVDGGFRRALYQADAALKPNLGWSVADEMLAGRFEPGQTAITRVQPMLFALGVALDAHWRGMGLSPTAVIGHSVGEVAAACSAGHLSLTDGALIITARSRVLERLSGAGGMAVVERNHEDALKDIAPYGGRIAVAGLNSPRLTVLSGELDALSALHEDLHKRQIFCRVIQDTAPSHSHLLEPELGGFREAIKGIKPLAGAGAFYSTVRAEVVQGTELTADYWVANLRQTVLFTPAFERMLKDGYRYIVEMAPSATLTVSCEEIIKERNASALVLPALRKGQSGKLSTALAQAGLFANGFPLPFDKILGEHGRPNLPLPNYAWDEDSYWLAWHDRVQGKGDAGPDPSADVESKSTKFLAPRWLTDVALPPPSGNDKPGRWLILCDLGGRVEAIAKALEQAGAEIVRLSRADIFNTPGSDPSGANPFAHVWANHFLSDRACTAVLDGWSMDGGLDERDGYGCGARLHLVQSMLGARLRNLPRLFVMEPFDPECKRPDTVFACASHGFLRALSYEQPDLAPKWIACDEGVDVKAVVQELLADDRDQRVRLTAQGRSVERLHRLPVPANHAQPVKIDPNATYLITGGFGGLGLALAEFLSREGARHIALMSRKATSEGRQAERIAALKEQGVVIHSIGADVSQRSDVDQALKRLAAHAPPLAGVFHAAGILDDGLIEGQSVDRLRKVMAAKVVGAWHLHEATASMPLDHFVLYGSISALVGSPGQSNYAAANAFFPALAQHRRSRGLPGLCMAWGAFSDTGLAADDAMRASRLEARGMGSLTVSDAHDALSWALAADIAECGVVEFNTRQWFDFYPRQSSSLYLSALPASKDDGKAGSSAVAFAATLRDAAPAECLRLAMTAVREEVARVLRYQPGRLDPDQPFNELGLDSLTGLELRNRLESRVGLNFSATLIWSSPTISALARYITDQFASPDDAGTVKAKPIVVSDTLASMSEQDLALRLAAEMEN